MEAKFETFPGKDGQPRFRLIAPNGEIIAASEGYSSMQKCKEGIAAVKKYAPDAEIVEAAK